MNDSSIQAPPPAPAAAAPNSGVSRLVMGQTDAEACAEGWGPLEDWAEWGGHLRRFAATARTLLEVPPRASHLGLEIRAEPAAVPFGVRTTIRDAWTAPADDAPAFVDLGFRPDPGVWETVEFELPAMIPEGSQVAVTLELVPLARNPAPGSAASGPKPPEAAVRGLWLRGSAATESELKMGITDDVPSIAGWGPSEDWGPWGGRLRRFRRYARTALLAPPVPAILGIEIWSSPAAGPQVLRVTARDRQVGKLPAFGPYLDCCVKIEPGAWETIELKLPGLPPPGSEMEVSLDSDGREPEFAVRRLWLRDTATKDVTIIVLNWNRRDETLACLDSLARADLGGAAVMMVDNGSRDGSADAVRARHPEVDVLELPENRGYAGGNNAGIRRALERGASAVLLLNNDTRVAPDFLRGLLWAINSRPRVAAVSGAIFRADRPEILDIAYLELFWGHGIVYQRGVNKLPGEGFDRRREVDAAVGSCILMTAPALHEIGLLDEDYFAYHEEVDWCYRARALGYRILYEPHSQVWHGGSRSTESADSLGAARRAIDDGEDLPTPVALSWSPVRAYLGGRNTVRFVRKHGRWREKLYFVLSSLYEVPLEFLAVFLRQEGALKIGAWTYRRALRELCLGRRRPQPGVVLGAGRFVAMLVLLPFAIVFRLPYEVWLASREGRTEQAVELVRGLWDGLLDRSLPADRLNLR